MKVDMNEGYEVKYKKLLASLKRLNFDVKTLIDEVENWADDEESSDEDKEKDKCLMARTDAFFFDEGGSRSSSVKFDLGKVDKDSKMLEWDSSSLYQVNKIVNYYDNEK